MLMEFLISFTLGMLDLWNKQKNLDQDPGKDFLHVSDALLQQIAKLLQFPVASLPPADAFTVVRKLFDARKVFSVILISWVLILMLDALLLQLKQPFIHTHMYMSHAL